jgi:hypothetical protein
VRVARLAVGAQADVPASAFYSGGSIDARIHRLLDEPPAPPLRRSHVAAVLIAGATVAGAAVMAFAPLLHGALEAIVAALP